MGDWIGDEDIDNAKELSQWYRELGEEEVSTFLRARGYGKNKLANEMATANQIETHIIRQAALMSGLSEEINTVWELQQNVNIAARMMTYDEQVKQAKELRDEVLAAAEASRLWANVENPEFLGVNIRNLTDNIATSKEEAALLSVNAYNAANGFKEGRNFAQAMGYLLDQTVDEAARAAAYTKELGDNLKGIPRSLNISIKADQLGEIHKAGMEGIMDDLTNAITDNFDNSMQDAIENNSDAWDDRVEGLQSAQERASDALERNQERQMERFDSRWELRKERVTDYYDKRIEATNKAIEAEQRAEEIRQRIFDAEQTRLDRLAEAANQTIDFNLALQTGELDEAAKIRNDMEAQAAGWALADAGAAEQRASERRIKRLENRADRLGKRKDEVLEQMETREEAQRESLERRQDAERKHLDKVQKMNLDALNEQADNAKEAYEKMWEHRKDNLEREMDTVKSFVPKNMKQLKAWLAESGITYERFGLKFLKPTSDKWGQFFETSYKQHTRDAGLEIANSNMWEVFGKKQARGALRGMGFGNLRQFERFIMTGELPNDFGTHRTKDTGRGDPQAQRNKFEHDLGVRHGGGWVGGGSNSRKGVANNYKGVHPSEQLLLARKREFVVNEDAAKAHGSLLEGINNGTVRADSPRNIGRGIGGPSIIPGMAGLVAAMTTRGLVSGVAKSFEGRYDEKQRELRAAQPFGIFGGPLGNYNLGGVLPWVLEAANYLGGKFGIKSIGGIGNRPSNPTSDHPKGLALDFMINNLSNGIAVGNALANEAIKLNRALDATYLIWNARIHSFDSRGWQPYSHPSGATDPTSLHKDHVHISFSPSGDTGDLPSPLGGGTSRRGGGGLYYPSIPGKGWGNSHDYGNGMKSPLFAIANGMVRAYQLPPSAGSGQHPNAWPRGYGSYGVTSVLTTGSGDQIRYAHMYPGTQVSGRVRAGQQIGLSAATGYATGPHTHFEVNGSEAAREWFAAHGIGLRKGGVTASDGIANIHKDEVVVDPGRTKQLFDRMDTFFKATKGSNDATVPTFEQGNWTWLSGIPEIMKNAKKKNANKVKNATKNVQNLGQDQILDTGNRSVVRMGTLNTYVGTSAKATIGDLARLLPLADILTLTEVKGKFDALRRYLAGRNWGLHGGKGRDARGSVLAWNKSKYDASQFGTRQLGKQKADILGGRELRYANYALMKDRSTGRKMWQVAAHTVPTPGFDKAHRRLFFEQWGNIDKLVGELRGTGAPVFLSGDLNERRERPWFRTPEGLEGAQGLSVDWIFHDKRMAQFMRRSIVKGMHTDHAGALLSQYNIPGLAKGGQIRWNNTLANLHKGETVLTADLSNQLRDGIGNFASGAGNEYNVTVNVSGADVDEDVIVRKTMTAIKQLEGRKPVRRTNRR